MIDIVNFDGGNMGSVIRCFERLHVPHRVVRSAAEFDGGSPVVLPGVGSFGSVMQALQKAELDSCIVKAVNDGVPFLGICIGLQLIFEASEESPGANGLGLLKGKVVRFTSGKVPQIGWNSITPASGNDLPSGYVYFVNSYHVVPQDKDAVMYWSDYGGPFCAAVQKDNITAFQFHPEKSGAFGYDLLRRWLDAL